MNPCLASPPAQEISGISRISQLRSLQAGIAGLACRPASSVDMPLSWISGRVLAETVPARAPEGPHLSEGTLLNATHVPMLTDLGLSAVRVFDRIRVGIISLLDEGPLPIEARRNGADTATMLAMAAEQMGAKAFAYTCKSSDERLLVQSLTAFAASCSLVLVIGRLGSELRAALGHAGLLGDSHQMRDLDLQPFGELQMARAGAAHLIALPAEPMRAFATFTAFVSPLLRALTGRTDVLPPMASAILVDGEEIDLHGRGLLWVHEQPGSPCSDTTFVKRAAGTGAASLAGASGLAWRPMDLHRARPAGVAYLALRSWLG